MSQRGNVRLLMLDHRNFSDFDYAIINPAQIEPDQWRDLPSTPLKPRGFRVPPEIMPHIVVLNVLSVDERLRLLERCEGWARTSRMPVFSGLLVSKASPEIVGRHLVAQMRTLIAGQSYWLRFHDPRVVARLSWLLNDRQLRRLFGPIRTWAWFDVLERGWKALDKPAESPAHLPANLDAMQSAALQRLPWLNRCLRSFAQTRGSSSGLHAVAQRIDGHLSKAVALGLNSPDDACAYALHIERHGEGWDEWPANREAIDSALRGEQSLVRALAGTCAAAQPMQHVDRSHQRDME